MKLAYTDSKSRTSISLNSSQPGLAIMPNGNRFNKKRDSSSHSNSILFEEEQKYENENEMDRASPD